MLGAHVDFDELGAGKELHDHAGGDDWGDTELHECSLVGGKDNAEPVKGVSAFLTDGSVERDLTADQVHEKCKRSPEKLLSELNLLHGCFDLRQEILHWGHQVDETETVTHLIIFKLAKLQIRVF